MNRIRLTKESAANIGPVLHGEFAAVMHALPRCVVVDDDPEFLTLMLGSLRTAFPGATPIGFDNPLDALQYLRSNSVEIILTDFRMPFVNGLQLVAAVRLVDPDVRIIMLSSIDLHSAAVAGGANAFILKPDLLHSLHDTLAALGFACVAAS